MRERQLNIRLSEEESERFERVASHFGLNIAATIRMLFKEKARDLGFEPSAIAEALTVREGAVREGRAPAKSFGAERLKRGAAKKLAK